MPENCADVCAGLTRLEQQVDDLRRQNGNDHKEFRTQIQQMGHDSARTEGKLDNIVVTLTDLKTDNKEIINKLSPITHKSDEIDKLKKDVEEIKGASGKRWDGIVTQVIGLIVAALVGFMMTKLI